MKNAQSGTSVLVVDDDPFLRLYAADFLEEAGFEVLHASNADEAVSTLQSCPDIDVVLTDIQMPGSMDGLALARTVSEYWPGILVIVTSGMHRPKRGDLAEDVPFLAKPYLPEKVVELVNQTIGSPW